MTSMHYPLFVLALFAAGALPADPATDLRLELSRESLTGAHCRYRVWSDGLPTDQWTTLACPGGVGAAALLTAGAPVVEGRWRIEGRTVERRLIADDPLQPYLHDYDAATGELVRRVPFFLRAKSAWVFDPNPVVTLNDPTLQDRNDAASAVPDHAYSLVELLDVAASGPLRGPHVTIVDRQPPNIPPPDASMPLLFDRSDDGFEAVNAYFHIDRNQRHLQALGYTGSRRIVPYSIEVDAHAVSGADNSFFIPSSTVPGRGTLYFGTGGTDDAEEGDLLVHEYAHAILEWISPGTFGGPFASQARALGEGYSDYWAYSAHLEARLASGRDPFCFADWDPRCWENDPPDQCSYPPGSDCLRRLDSPRTMADYQSADVSGVEYPNGEIWSSALREMHQAMVARYGLERARRLTDTMIVESVFGAPPQPTFAVMAQRLVEADRLLSGGAHGEIICRAMAARGILADCAGGTRQARSLFQSSGRRLPIPENDPAGVTSTLTITDTRTIDRLFVRVDIAHPARGDLRIDLVAPDGTVVMLQQVSLSRAADVRTTFGLTAVPSQPLDVLRGRSAAGVWRLVVRDLRAHDTGTLLSWALLIEFAGESPLASRPRGEGQMIPAVANAYGVGAARFVSDVRLANPRPARERATLIFTRSGADGLDDFTAVDVVLEPGQTVAFDDVVSSLFHTVGSGTLEVLGDVIVMSRTYVTGEGGTLGQQVPPNLETTDLQAWPLFVTALPSEGFRWNVGVTETSGSRGIVLVEPADTRIAGRIELTIEPYSHLQVPVSWPALRIRVDSGDARISAYLSQVDHVSGDAMFIPARKRETPVGAVMPAISATGADGGEWKSDLWVGNVDSVLTVVPWMHVRYVSGSDQTQTVVLQAPVLTDVVAATFGVPGTAGAIEVVSGHATILHSRITHAGTSQYVPALELTDDAEQHLLFIENGGGYRTNIGITSSAPALAEVIVYDAAGSELERRVLHLERGTALMPVAAPVTAGRAVVRILEGRARAAASLIDARSGDATFIPGQ